ncbi:MAG: helix-turn-helix domain-containing protein [Phycisphaerales bacterium JB040]
MSRFEAGRSPKNQQNNESLDTNAFPKDMPRWLSVNQIREMQRCRRETVLDAMLSGELPFEQRGRIRYARLSDVIRWEERRLRPDAEPVRGLIHPDLEEFV